MESTAQSVFTNFETAVEFRLFSERKHLTLSLPEQIAAQLGDQIIGGVLADGTHIPEQELAERYQVSRGPIRDALRILEREGLVTLNPRRGACVSELNATELGEIFEVRSSLLAVAGRKNALARNPELIELLTNGLKELRLYVDTPSDGSRYAELVFRLSLLSARYAGNSRLTRMVTSLSLQTLRYSKLQFRSKERRTRSFELWRQALDALKAGDADLAEKLSQDRVRESWAATVAALQT